MDEEALNFVWEFDLDELWLLAESLKTSLERMTKFEDPSVRIYYVLKQKNLAKSLANALFDTLENEGIDLQSLEKDMEDKLSTIADTLNEIVEYRTVSCLQKEEIPSLNMGFGILNDLCTREEEPELYHILCSRITW